MTFAIKKLFKYVKNSNWLLLWFWIKKIPSQEDLYLIDNEIQKNINEKNEFIKFEVSRKETLDILPKLMIFLK
jgi:hypothetical protein